MVKKALRIIALIQISVLYCFVISLYSSNALVENTAFSKLTDSESKHRHALVASDLLSISAHAEISVPAFNAASSSSSLKNPLNGFLAWVKITEQLFFSLFSQYSFYSQNVLVRFQRTDIIFPFHYFW